MIIDFRKLVVQLLPPTLRRVIISSWVYTLASEISALYEHQRKRIEYLRVQSACTPQTVWLERIVKHETGIDVAITEHNHSPYDFMVDVVTDSQSNNEINRVDSVINRYKMAGKSYTFRESIAYFECNFGGFVCTKRYADGNVTFGGWQCVQEIVNLKAIGTSTETNLSEGKFYVTILSDNLDIMDGTINVTVRVKGSSIGANANLSKDVPASSRMLLCNISDYPTLNPSLHYEVTVLRNGSDITYQFNISKN